ncbi:MAG: T9SS type A sorting domain-containing protein [Bacteroidetes bacterium]|nr:T9SS type A sorting domain-containing protein [Bacteroidota bacterium]
MGDLKLAPDNKIYLSMCYVDTFGTYFPYLPTVSQFLQRIQNGYYTRDLSMLGYAAGAYIVVIQTEEERLTKKLIK